MTRRFDVRVALTCAITALLMTAGAGVAQAGTAQVSQGVVIYDASPGQDNAISATKSGNVVTITDTATPPVTIDAGAGCFAVTIPPATTPSSALCDGTNLTTVVLDGKDGNDQLTADSTITVQAQLFGQEGNDTLNGGPGDDLLEGGPGADTVNGNDGHDLMSSDGCGDVMNGGAGPDHFDLEGGTTAHGGDGDDDFTPVLTSHCTQGDNVFGDAGHDTLNASGVLFPTGWQDVGPGVSFITLDDVANDGPLADDGTPSGSNFHSDIEDVVGGPEDDLIIGTTGPNTLDGGPGDDDLEGDLGTDVLKGGDGEDIADYFLHENPVTVTLDGQANDGEAGENDLVSSDIEDIDGGDGNDTLTGNSVDNVFDGGPGADTFHGGGGMDVVDYSFRTAPVHADLDGSAGNDGEANEHDTIGNDVEGLLGGDGNDVLVGNSSSGVLFGGAGADQLTDTAGGSDLISGGPGADVINSRDGAVDTVGCGAETDAVTADVNENVAADCENVVRASANPVDTHLTTAFSGFYLRSNTTVFTFSATIAGSTFICNLDGQQSACTSPFTARNLRDASHQFIVTAVGPDNVRDPTPSVVNFTVDTIKPKVSVKLPSSRCVGHTPAKLKIQAPDADGLTSLVVKLGKKRLTSVAAQATTVKVSKTLIHKYGNRLRVSATDSAGNTANKSVYLKRCS